MSRFREALTRKFGPFPAWVYLIAFAGVVYWWRRRQAGKAQVVLDPANAPGVADSQVPQEPVTLSPGQSVYNPNSGQLVGTAPEQFAPLPAPDRPIPVTLDPGQTVYDPATGALVGVPPPKPPAAPTAKPKPKPKPKPKRKPKKKPQHKPSKPVSTKPKRKPKRRGFAVLQNLRAAKPQARAAVAKPKPVAARARAATAQRTAPRRSVAQPATPSRAVRQHVTPVRAVPSGGRKRR